MLRLWSLLQTSNGCPSLTQDTFQSVLQSHDPCLKPEGFAVNSKTLSIVCVVDSFARSAKHSLL